MSADPIAAVLSHQREAGPVASLPLQWLPPVTPLVRHASRKKARQPAPGSPRRLLPGGARHRPPVL